MVAVPPPPIRVPIVDLRTGLPTLIFRSWLQAALKRMGGSGTSSILSGPESSTDNAAVRFNGTAGDTFQDSGVLIDDSDNVTIPGTLDVTGQANLNGAAAVTGNITITGTVDGRDVATDGTKLDGIEASADVNDVDSVFSRTGAVVATRGDYEAGQITQAVKVFQTTVGQAALASAGTVTLLDASTGEQWRVRELFLSGDGTNFSGGGGDRLLSVSDGTTIWTVIPAATLQSLAIARWFDTGVPAPATAGHFTTASGAGVDIVAAYSGGSADYTVGELTIIVIAERIA